MIFIVMLLGCKTATSVTISNIDKLMIFAIVLKDLGYCQLIMINGIRKQLIDTIYILIEPISFVHTHTTLPFIIS